MIRNRSGRAGVNLDGERRASPLIASPSVIETQRSHPTVAGCDLLDASSISVLNVGPAASLLKGQDWPLDEGGPHSGNTPYD